MPLLFIGSYLESLSYPDLPAQGSVHIRINPGEAAAGAQTNQAFLAIQVAPTLRFFALTKQSGDEATFGFYTDGVSALLTTTATAALPAGEWASHLFTWDTAAPLRHWYRNNTLLVSDNSPFVVPSGTSHFTIGQGGGVNNANSFIAAHARWDRVLTAAEREALVGTLCPLFIREGLTHYHPMTGLESAGHDLMGNLRLSVAGSPPGAPYETLIVPYSAQSWRSAETLPFNVPLISNPITLHAPSLTTSAAGVLNVPLQSIAVTLYPLIMSTGSEGPTAEDERTVTSTEGYKQRITTFVAGDDLRLVRTYDGLPEGITISKAYLTIKQSRNDADADAAVQISISPEMAGQGMIDDPSTDGGSVSLYFDLAGSQTAALRVAHSYDVTLISGLGAIYTAELGIIVLHRGVTEATS